MPTAPTTTRQTAKQAKAAFKARGSSHVSSVERRKLERGAQLLERADRAKAQERRKKEWMKKREEQGNQQKSDEGSKVLGSQLRLDKFGYKSSQFHLGHFFGPPKTSLHRDDGNGANKDDYDDDDGLDEGTLLELDQSTSNPEDAIRGQDCSIHGAADWSDFLETSTQIARELSGSIIQESTTPQKTKRTLGRSRSLVSVPSWNSDEAFNDEDLAELDNQIESARRQIQMDQDKLLMPPPRFPAFSKSSASVLAAPPKLVSSESLPSARAISNGTLSSTNVPALNMLSPANPFISAMMPPPRLPTPIRNSKLNINVLGASSKSRQVATKMLPPKVIGCHKTDAGNVQSRKDSNPSLASYGISIADLESLAADDIVLSQWSGG